MCEFIDNNNNKCCKKHKYGEYCWKHRYNYLLDDNRTLVMISAVKILNKNFKFDINKKKLELYPKNGKFNFIISSIAKSCGHNNFNDNYKCSFYKPLISSTLIK